MEQLTLVEAGRIEWRDVAEPQLEGGDDALVRPLAVTRCDIDLPYASGLLPPPNPFALGHECVGEIAALGDKVRGLHVGQRVIVPFQISCGHCARCRVGHTGSCSSVPFLSAFGLPLSGREWGGALSGLLRVPFAEAMLVAAPNGVPAWCLAAAADNASDGWRCVAQHLAERPGAPVLVLVGLAPSVALYAADAALALGAERVDVASPDQTVLGIAERIGANPIQTNFEGKLGPYPITVDGAGDPAALSLAIRSTDLEGVCTSAVYYPFNDVALPMGRMYTKGVRLFAGRCHARSVLPAVADAIAAQRLHPEIITTRRVAWSDAAAAMAEPAIKLVVDREAA